MSVAHKAVSVLAASILALPLGCESDSERGEPGARPDPGDTRTPSADITDARKCLGPQRRAVWDVGTQVQRLVRRVLSRPDELPNDVAEPLARRMRSVQEETQSACGGAPPALAKLVGLVDQGNDSAASGTFPEPLLREIVDAYETWARASRKPQAAAVIYDADPCSVLAARTRPRYEIHRRPESGGVAVWIELVITNEWLQTVTYQHGGEIEVTGIRPDGGTRTFSWGGSSADIETARPERTWRNPVDLFETSDRYLHLVDGGDVRVYDADGLMWAGAVGPCQVEPKSANGP